MISNASNDMVIVLGKSPVSCYLAGLTHRAHT